jgi:lipid-A-disaccharide synthase
MRIFLTAGEPSGDALGAGLIGALREESPQLFVTGVGGPLMEAAGLKSLFPQSDLAVMGIAEIVPRLPRLLRRIEETAQAIADQRPDLVITIDAPDFSFRVVRRARRLLGANEKVKFIHYVAPSVWAWRAGRAAKMAGFLNRVLCLLPFEPPYFERVGLSARFVGHPLAAIDRPAAVPPFAPPTLCLLPGSRRGEIARHLPVFLATLRRLRESAPNLQAVLPTLPHLAEAVASATRDQVTIIDAPAKHATALAQSTAALSASGTVTLEVALAGVAQVIAYRVNPLSAAVARRLLRVAHVGLPNVILAREIVPERLQESCTAEALATALAPLLADTPARAAQTRAVAALHAALLPEGGAPARAAALAALELLG